MPVPLADVLFRKIAGPVPDRRRPRFPAVQGPVLAAQLGAMRASVPSQGRDIIMHHKPHAAKLEG